MEFELYSLVMHKIKWFHKPQAEIEDVFFFTALIVHAIVHFTPLLLSSDMEDHFKSFDLLHGFAKSAEANWRRRATSQIFSATFWQETLCWCGFKTMTWGKKPVKLPQSRRFRDSIIGGVD